MFKREGILWEGGVNSGSVAYISKMLKGDVFWDGSVHSGSVAYISKMLKEGCILGWKRTFWECRIYI